MTKQNEALITTVNRLCAVEEHARRVFEEINPKWEGFSKRQSHALLGLSGALADLDAAREKATP